MEQRVGDNLGVFNSPHHQRNFDNVCTYTYNDMQVQNSYPFHKGGYQGRPQVRGGRRGGLGGKGFYRPQEYNCCFCFYILDLSTRCCNEDRKGILILLILLIPLLGLVRKHLDSSQPVLWLMSHPSSNSILDRAHFTTRLLIYGLLKDSRYQTLRIRQIRPLNRTPFVLKSSQDMKHGMKITFMKIMETILMLVKDTMVATVIIAKRVLLTKKRVVKTKRLPLLKLMKSA
ncbi:hypothetical protein M9H77_06798 [Catharanthus roseus]|uniref:Uncharacterized protein n=1 Tax=Catharanthus roseus TaxID=4058 RepID=A0ACC0BT46_CATRO|nr:hypothetical protein M9H77_06798 [Catharanthus roseus]